MITEQQKIRLVELQELCLSNKEIAKILDVSESTVKRHSSDNYDEDNDDYDTPKTKKAKKSGFNLDDIDENEQLRYDLNRIAQMLDRTPSELLVDILEMLFAWSSETENILEIFDYSFYIATLVKKLKFSENTKERELIDFLLECKKDWEEIENVKDELEEALEEFEKIKNDIIELG